MTHTTTPRLQPRHKTGLQTDRLAAQPWTGLGGLLLATAVFFALALGTGSTTSSLLVLGPISTFALPAVAVVAFWWNDWPGSRLTTPWTGLIDTVLVAAAAVVLTTAGQAIVERPGLRGVFDASPSPGTPTTFPATLALAGAAFTAMLQLSLVCERWPLGGTGRLRSGIAALVLSWAIGAGAYFLFVNLDAIPAAERAAAGLRNPGGPIAAPDFGSALIAVGLWQAVFFIVLRGWPVNTITRRPARLLVGNALVISLGAVTYLVLRNLAHWQPDAISAACGCIISATLIVAMLFEGWPAARLPPAPGRALTLALTALVALALDRALTAYADSVRWTRATPNQWITTAALSFAPLRPWCRFSSGPGSGAPGRWRSLSGVPGRAWRVWRHGRGCRGARGCWQTRADLAWVMGGRPGPRFPGRRRSARAAARSSWRGGHTRRTHRLPALGCARGGGQAEVPLANLKACSSSKRPGRRATARRGQPRGPRRHMVLCGLRRRAGAARDAQHVPRRRQLALPVVREPAASPWISGCTPRQALTRPCRSAACLAGEVSSRSALACAGVVAGDRRAVLAGRPFLPRQVTALANTLPQASRSAGAPLAGQRRSARRAVPASMMTSAPRARRAGRAGAAAGS